jgi:hypothetical protein
MTPKRPRDVFLAVDQLEKVIRDFRRKRLRRELRGFNQPLASAFFLPIQFINAVERRRGDGIEGTAQLLPGRFTRGKAVRRFGLLSFLLQTLRILSLVTLGQKLSEVWKSHGLSKLAIDTVSVMEIEGCVGEFECRHAARRSMRAFEGHVPDRQAGHLLDQADTLLPGTNMPAPVIKQLKHVLISLTVFGHWIKMRQSLARFSGLELSVHTRSLADFITTTSGFRFSVHTGVR